MNLASVRERLGTTQLDAGAIPIVSGRSPASRFDTGSPINSEDARQTDADSGCVGPQASSIADLSDARPHPARVSEWEPRLSVRSDAEHPAAFGREGRGGRVNAPAKPRPRRIDQGWRRRRSRRSSEVRPTTLFAAFEPTPFASASIAQVHYARLHRGRTSSSGSEGRHREPVEADLSMLGGPRGARGTPRRGLSRITPVEFVPSVRQDDAVSSISARAAQHPAVSSQFAAERDRPFPGPVSGACSGRVLTMERLEGNLVSRRTL